MTQTLYAYLDPARRQLLERKEALDAELAGIDEALSLIEQVLEKAGSATDGAAPGRRRRGRPAKAQAARAPGVKSGKVRRWFERGAFPGIASGIVRKAGGKIKTSELIAKLTEGMPPLNSDDAEKFKFAVLSQLETSKKNGLLKTVGKTTGTQERTWAVGKATG